MRLALALLSSAALAAAGCRGATASGSGAEAGGGPTARTAGVAAPLPTEGPAVAPGEATAPTAAGGAPVLSPALPARVTADQRARYAWLGDDVAVRPLSATIATPNGFHRAALPAGSFGAWLRELPLRSADSAVHAYDGRQLHPPGDPRVAAVAELDVSPADLQQCADSVIRLHAEWQWSSGERGAIGYHFLSGDYATFQKYAAGQRPQVDGPRVTWATVAPPNDGRKAFRAYLDMVFNYASTISLAQRQATIDKAQAAPGDFVVLPGGPGHAILILDVAEDGAGHRVALLGQGFMPAQDFHVLASGEGASPWFSLDGDAIDTPFWPVPFPWSSLRRFAPPS